MLWNLKNFFFQATVSAALKLLSLELPPISFSEHFYCDNSFTGRLWLSEMRVKARGVGKCACDLVKRYSSFSFVILFPFFFGVLVISIPKCRRFGESQKISSITQILPPS